MRALSNLLGRGDPQRPESVEHGPAVGEESRAALALILGGGGVPADDARVADFLEFVAQRGIDLSLLRVARVGGRVAWAVLPVLSPGKTMLLLHPGAPAQPLDAGPVIRSVCDLGAARGVQLAQALLDPADAPAADLFVREGFVRMAQLLYLHAVVRQPLPPPPLPPGLQWETYGAHNHSLFAQTILRSYQGSLDCPALNGMRDVEDIVAGHKAGGEFDPNFWFLLSGPQGPQAVLLLGRVPRTDGMELVYLGLVPEARGRGIGDLLVRQTLWAVRRLNLSLVSLAVDARNEPALKLYYRHGLRHVGSKLAVMRDGRTAPAESAPVHT